MEGNMMSLYAMAVTTVTDHNDLPRAYDMHPAVVPAPDRLSDSRWERGTGTVIRLASLKEG